MTSIWRRNAVDKEWDQKQYFLYIKTFFTHQKLDSNCRFYFIKGYKNKTLLKKCEHSGKNRRDIWVPPKTKVAASGEKLLNAMLQDQLWNWASAEVQLHPNESIFFFWFRICYHMLHCSSKRFSCQKPTLCANLKCRDLII